MKTPEIMQIIELLGKKWLMRIIWELRGEPLTFRELQSRCGDISPTVLNTRLRDLELNDLMLRSEGKGYRLSEIGLELLQVYKPLNEWAIRWVKLKGQL